LNEGCNSLTLVNFL